MHADGNGQTNAVLRKAAGSGTGSGASLSGDRAHGRAVEGGKADSGGVEVRGNSVRDLNDTTCRNFRLIDSR